MFALLSPLFFTFDHVKQHYVCNSSPNIVFDLFVVFKLFGGENYDLKMNFWNKKLDPMVNCQTMAWGLYCATPPFSHMSIYLLKLA